MDHSCSKEGLGNDRIRCTKFNEGCTKFCEGCTKGSKVHSEMGMRRQSLSYGFLNEIMDHPCSDEGLESDRMECTKFNEGCTKFYEGCSSKVCYEVGMAAQSFSYGFLNEIMDHPFSDGGPGNNRIEYTKFNK